MAFMAACRHAGLSVHTSTLERNPGRYLDVPFAGCRRDLAEIAGIEITHRVPEMRCVRQVIEFAAELQPDALANHEVANQGNIVIHQPGSENSIPPRISEPVRTRLAKR